VISDFLISCDFVILKVISVISEEVYEISEVSDPLLCLEGVFLSQLKTGRSDRPQTWKPAFLVYSSGVLQLESSVLGVMSITSRECISRRLESGHDAYLRERK